MLSLKFPDRDSLGWLIPILLFCICYGGFLWFNEAGLARSAGVLFFIIGLVGLSFSRRIRRIVGYYLGPKTDERREAFQAATMMARAKRQARQEGVPELVTDLYFHYIVNFPHWLEEGVDEDEKIIPSIVTIAKKMPGNRLHVVISGREYVFTFVEYVYAGEDGGSKARATLQVSTMNQKLILIHLVPAEQEEKPSWRPLTLEYVAMSDWINDFRHLQELINEEKERRQHEDQMN